MPMGRYSETYISILAAAVLLLAGPFRAGGAAAGKETGGFRLVRDGRPAPVCCLGESEVVRTALGMYVSDVEKVTGRTPGQGSASDDGTIVVGTLSESGAADSLARAWGVDTDVIEGHWEAFRICEVVKDGKSRLLVLGSDPRGTAYGVLELSRRLGVSPWEWWADVAPRKAGNVSLPSGVDIMQEPSVQYRGIFLNDEDWGLDVWGTAYEGSFIPGCLGPKVYSRIFELLLRLRANTFWPAMHASTVAFYKVPGNREAASRYGIVTGTSHCEPMMRNNVGEWDSARYGDYNFASNRKGVLGYWRERVQEVSSDETIFTLGMRGIHDGKMEGAVTLGEQTALTNEVIRAQRALLSDCLHRPVGTVPQVFVPYKEVLDIYRNGVELPQDVTLMWCDDNYGYITRLSDEDEQSRSGGSGVYYHVSYYGKPHDYLWLATSQPALMVSEMDRAYSHGARKLWILNVGDLKPAEYHMELFLDMAWDIRSVSVEDAGRHIEGMLERDFGTDAASEALALLDGHWRLAAERKPEHMGWSRIQQPGVKGGITPVHDTEYGSFCSAAFRRIEAYDELCRRAEELGKKLPADRRDAWFELVEYPLKGASLMNRKLLFAQFARHYAAENLAAGAEYRDASVEAYDSIRALTDVYNREIAGGKWNGIMSMSPRNLPVFSAPEFRDWPEGYAGNRSLLWVEGEPSPLAPDSGRGTVHAALPAFMRSAGNEVLLHVFGQEGSLAVKDKPEWLDVRTVQMVPSHGYMVLSADFQAGAPRKGTLSLSFGGLDYTVSVRREDDTSLAGAPVVGGISAAAGSGYSGAEGVTTLKGLGQSGQAVLIDKGGKAEYLLRSPGLGEAEITACFLPRHPESSGTLRFRLWVDGRDMGEYDISEVFGEEPWKVNVLRNQARESIPVNLPEGACRIGIEPLDEAMILDGVVLGRKGMCPYSVWGLTVNQIGNNTLTNL